MNSRIVALIWVLIGGTTAGLWLTKKEEMSILEILVHCLFWPITLPIWIVVRIFEEHEEKSGHIWSNPTYIPNIQTNNRRSRRQ